MPFVATERLRSLPPYLFADIDQKRRAAIDAGRDIIDYGVGDPDRPTHPFIIEAMVAALQNPANHSYPLGGGRPRFRQGIRDFFAKRYGVELDAQRQLLALIGSKEGIGHLPLAAVNPGQTVLVPAPGYPAYLAATVFAGGTPHIIELSAENGWKPDFDAIPAEVADKAALMFLNYPNNPTGATASLSFFERAIEFAREHNIVLAHDAAYNELYLGDERPPSILQVKGALDVAIEFHSASKTFNMTGWRAGFVVGQADVIGALARIKSNVDSGLFAAIQETTAVAYDNIDGPEVRTMRELYRRRAELLCAGLRQVGFSAEPPTATFYVWARVPRGYDSLSVCNKMLEEADVVGVPGSGFGPTGEGYIRFSLSVPDARMEETIERLRKLDW